MRKIILKICENPKCKKEFETCYKKTKYCKHKCYVKHKKAIGIYPGSFKKGTISINTIKEGSVVIRKDMHSPNRSLRNYIKIGKYKFIRNDKYVWEQKHGKIQKGLM